MFAANGGAVSDTSKTYIEDVFSTYLYTGNGSTQDINNGIGLSSTLGFDTYSLNETSGIITDVASDSSNNTYTVGYYNDGSSNYGFITKRNISGQIMMYKNIIGTSYIIKGIAVHSSGNIYTCSQDGTVLKMDSAGTKLWELKLEYSTGWLTPTSIAVDSSGNCYVMGSTPVATTKFVYSLNSSGSLRWSKSFSGYAANKVRVDSSDNIYVVGQSISYEAVTYKLNTSGDLTWSKVFKVGQPGNNAQAVAYDATIDTSGNVYVAMQLGESNVGATAWGPGVVKYDSSGTIQWIRKPSYSVYNLPVYKAISIDSSGNIIAAGQVDYGSSTTGNVILSSFTAAGDHNYTKKITYPGTIQLEPISLIIAGGYASLAIYIPSGYYSVVRFKDGSSSINGYAYVTIKDEMTLTINSPAASADYSAGSLSSFSTITGSSSTSTGNLTQKYITQTQPLVDSDGGMVWIKSRTNGGAYHRLQTVEGSGYRSLYSNSNAVGGPLTSSQFAFTPSGFTNYLGGDFNASSENFVSWTFRKAPKFFDVVTYTGNGVAGRQISHSLGQAPGMIIVKRTDSAGNWVVYHRSATFMGLLNTTDPFQYTHKIPAVSSTTFTTSPTDDGVGTTNANGATYVAYLFAHDTTTDGLIQCGAFNYTAGTDVNLGWEPQYLLMKRTNASEGWFLVDTMRGWTTDSTSAWLVPNTSEAEVTPQALGVAPTATGFRVPAGYGTNAPYIYMAIRRGPMRAPTDGTKVYMPVVTQSTGTIPSTVARNTGFSVDAYFGGVRNTTFSKHMASTRLQGKDAYLVTSGPNQENWAGDLVDNLWDNNTGISITDSNGSWNGNNASQSTIFHCLKRAPGFFDVVCYTGTGVDMTVNHNLGVAPELMIVKIRNAIASYDWFVYAAPIGATQYLGLNQTYAAQTLSSAWSNTSPTSSVFTVGNANGTNRNGNFFVAYLFASSPGVSKVGSYTGNGSSQTINCGFAAGARFVLIKRTDSTGDWYVWDTARGIVSSTDPHLSLNNSNAEVTNDDTIDPDSAGFVVNQVSATDVNVNSATYIYLAIA